MWEEAIDCPQPSIVHRRGDNYLFPLWWFQMLVVVLNKLLGYPDVERYPDHEYYPDAVC